MPLASRHAFLCLHILLGDPDLDLVLKACFDLKAIKGGALFQNGAVQPSNFCYRLLGSKHLIIVIRLAPAASPSCSRQLCLLCGGSGLLSIHKGLPGI